jgi:hypothetical protein
MSVSKKRNSADLVVEKITIGSYSDIDGLLIRRDKKTIKSQSTIHVLNILSIFFFCIFAFCIGVIIFYVLIVNLT